MNGFLNTAAVVPRPLLSFIYNIEGRMKAELLSFICREKLIIIIIGNTFLFLGALNRKRKEKRRKTDMNFTKTLKQVKEVCTMFVQMIQDKILFVIYNTQLAVK